MTPWRFGESGGTIGETPPLSWFASLTPTTDPAAPSWAASFLASRAPCPRPPAGASVTGRNRPRHVAVLGSHLQNPTARAACEGGLFLSVPLPPSSSARSTSGSV